MTSGTANASSNFELIIKWTTDWYHAITVKCGSSPIQMYVTVGRDRLCLILWHVVMPPITRGQTWLFQPLPKTGRNQSDSGYRGLEEEDCKLSNSVLVEVGGPVVWSSTLHAELPEFECSSRWLLKCYTFNQFLHLVMLCTVWLRIFALKSRHLFIEEVILF